MRWSELTQLAYMGLVAVVLLIICVHLYMHNKKFGSEHLILRTVFLIIGLIGLVLLFLKPKTSSEIRVDNAILLTANAGLPIEDENSTYNNVHDLLNDAKKSIDTIIIKGDGLRKEELALLDSFNIKFEAGTKRDGFVELNIPVIKEQQTWRLTGRINCSGPHRISVDKNNGDVQETMTDDDGYFALRLTSESAGHFAYNIHAHYPDSTFTEVFPIEVLAPVKWKLLALSSTPSFELNYLKNYWVRLGNGFSLRQKVSDLRYTETFLINPKMDLDKLNNETLHQFNFILVDVPTWNALKDEEQNRTLNYVANGRLGLLFFGLEEGDVAENINQLRVEAEKEIILENSDVTLSQLELPAGFSRIKNNNITSAGMRRYGLGRIGVMAINDTYRYILADQNWDYQDLWADVFSALYIAQSEDVVYSTNQWNWENEETEINIYSRKKIAQKAKLNSVEDILLDQTIGQDGMYYTSVQATTGWNMIQVNGIQNGHKYFVHPINSWQAMKQFYLHESNRLAAAEVKNLVTKPIYEQKELPFYYGLILSIIGLGLLWLHERMYS